jgi:general transcription factor IIIA
MAPKRKVTEASSAAVPQKRAKPGMLHSCMTPQPPLTLLAAAEEEVQLGWQSDDSEDYIINYTDNGTLRADSEARRQWNYVCTVDGCDQRFNRPCRLKAHVQSHNKERPFACDQPDCDKTFPRKDHLQRHLKNAHSDPAVQRTFTCDWAGCGKSFTSNGRLQRHRDVHDSKFYCTGFPPCNEAFRKETALEAHVKTQHLEVKPYPCTFEDPETGDRCTSGYQTEGALQRHVHRVHSLGQDSEIFCMICAELGQAVDSDDMGDMTYQPLMFATPEELTAHVQKCHPPECKECGQRFKNDSNLKSHMDTVHADPSQQPRFPCPKENCDSVFNRKHNLAVHIQTVHDKQARYFCAPGALQNSKHDDLKAWNGDNACGAAFKAKSSLDQHVRTHHLGLGNRKQLRKAAKSKKKPEPSTLSMLTGVGYEQNREVSCLVHDCEVRFYMDRDLRRHMRATHNIPDDDIEEMIRERDALTGGQFWIGGLDDPMGMFDSVEPSMPHTPAPYFNDGALPLPMHGDSLVKPMDPPMNFFGQQFDDLSLFHEDAEMDMAMGLGALAPATDVQEGLQWDLLGPVEQYNMIEEH